MTRAEPWSVPARKTRTAPPGAGAKVCRAAALGSASKASHLGCHGTRYVRYGRGWYAYPVRTVHGALGASRPAPPVRHGRLVRVARTYQLEAARRTRQLSERLERVDRFRAVRGGSPLHLRHRPARKARLQRVRSVPRRHGQGELRALGRHRGQREQRWLQHDTRARSCRLSRGEKPADLLQVMRVFTALPAPHSKLGQESTFVYRL